MLHPTERLPISLGKSNRYKNIYVFYESREFLRLRDRMLLIIDLLFTGFEIFFDIGSVDLLIL